MEGLKGGLRETEDSAGLLSTLGPTKASFKDLNRAINVRILRKQPQSQEESIAMARTCVKILKSDYSNRLPDPLGLKILEW